MGLLNKAKEDVAAAAAKAEEKRLAQEAAAKKAAENKRNFLHTLFLDLKELIQEDDIKVAEVLQGWPFAQLLRGEEVVGYFHEIDESGSEYVSDYGCEVGWRNHELVFSPAFHYITGNTKLFFSVSFDKDRKEFFEEVGEHMVSFYKYQRWV